VNNLSRLVLVRVATGLGTLVAVAVVVFFGMSWLPGNAAQVALGHNATPAAVVALEHQFGLDRPIISQFFSWLGGMLHGDFGHSLPTGVTVVSLIGDKLRNTLILTAATMALLIPVGLLLGVLSAWRQDRVLDHIVGGTTLTLIAVPSFVLGTTLIVIFAFWLKALPAVSLIDPGTPITVQLLVLPVLALLGATIAQTIRMIRASMIDVLESPFVEMARLRGASERRILFTHALPNAIGPTIAILALNVPWLIGDVVVVEQVFGYRGLGTTLVGAVQSRDIPTVQAIAMIIATVIIVVNLLADVIVILLNPRLRRGG
jgi:peptide/nickel transport system permease protein